MSTTSSSAGAAAAADAPLPAGNAGSVDFQSLLAIVMQYFGPQVEALRSADEEEGGGVVSWSALEMVATWIFEGSAVLAHVAHGHAAHHDVSDVAAADLFKSAVNAADAADAQDEFVEAWISISNMLKKVPERTHKAALVSAVRKIFRAVLREMEGVSFTAAGAGTRDTFHFTRPAAGEPDHKKQKVKTEAARASTPTATPMPPSK
jgi:hypothetical protein